MIYLLFHFHHTRSSARVRVCDFSFHSTGAFLPSYPILSFHLLSFCAIFPRTNCCFKFPWPQKGTFVFFFLSNKSLRRSVLFVSLLFFISFQSLSQIKRKRAGERVWRGGRRKKYSSDPILTNTKTHWTRSSSIAGWEPAPPWPRPRKLSSDKCRLFYFA